LTRGQGAFEEHADGLTDDADNADQIIAATNSRALAVVPNKTIR